jgi:hypothetical protein
VALPLATACGGGGGEADERPDGPGDGPAAEVTAAPSCLATPGEPALRAWLEALTGEQAVPIDGQPVRIGERASAEGRAHARAYLAAAYQALGYTVTQPSYGSGTNLVATRAGTGGRALVVGAHYDAVPGVPGADDNGSGLAVQLAAARALAGCTLEGELRFVAFDEEELGFVGSRAYVAGLRAAGTVAQVQGMLNLDMMGYDHDDDGGYTIFECGRPEGAFLVEALLDRTRAVEPAMKVSRQCTGGGDHKTFWDARVPAVAFGEEFGRPGADVNPCYHRPCDRVDQLNFRYLVRLSHLTAATIATLANAR